jgi:hypothetical protein
MKTIKSRIIWIAHYQVPCISSWRFRIIREQILKGLIFKAYICWHKLKNMISHLTTSRWCLTCCNAALQSSHISHDIFIHAKSQVWFTVTTSLSGLPDRSVVTSSAVPRCQCIDFAKCSGFGRQTRSACTWSDRLLSRSGFSHGISLSSCRFLLKKLVGSCRTADNGTRTSLSIVG